MFYVYILLSESYNRYYIGSSENIEKRLKRHNAGLVRSTKAYIPWKVVYTEILPTRGEALAKEKEIKSYKGGNSFKKLFTK